MPGTVNTRECEILFIILEFIYLSPRAWYHNHCQSLLCGKVEVVLMATFISMCPLPYRLVVEDNIRLSKGTPKELSQQLAMPFKLRLSSYDRYR